MPICQIMRKVTQLEARKAREKLDEIKLLLKKGVWDYNRATKESTNSLEVLNKYMAHRATDFEVKAYKVNFVGYMR